MLQRARALLRTIGWQQVKRAVLAFDRGLTGLHDVTEQAPGFDQRRGGVVDLRSADLAKGRTFTHEQRTALDAHGGPNHGGDGDQRLLGAGGVQRFGAERRQPVQFDRPPCGKFRLPPLPIKKLRRHDARHQKAEQDKPIQRIGDRQRVVRPKKQEVERKKRGAAENKPHEPTIGGAATQDDEQIDHRYVRLVEAIPKDEHRDADKPEHDESNRHPPPANPRPPHDPVSKRYPTDGSVLMYRGLIGSSSILRRSWPTYTRKYCCTSPAEPVHTARNNCWCVSV
jgi:hypothetical protein